MSAATVLTPDPPGGSASAATHAPPVEGPPRLRRQSHRAVHRDDVSLVRLLRAAVDLGLGHPPASVLMQGFIIGSLTALTAFGLALIYKANMVINFAQADLGAVPASLAVASSRCRNVVVLAGDPAAAHRSVSRSARSSSSR